MLQNLEQRDEIKCSASLREVQFVQHLLIDNMALGAGLACGLPVEFNAVHFVTGLFCEIKKSAAAATYVQDPAQVVFPGESEGPPELRPIRGVIRGMLNLAIESFISNQVWIKKRKTTLLATVQFHDELLMNLSPGVRGKFMAQSLPKLSQLRPAELFGNVAFRTVTKRTDSGSR